MAQRYTLEDLLNIMKKLRSENGCPWDRQQTHESLLTSLLEEAYEVMNAIKGKDMDNLCEELGDLLLQVIFHSQIAFEQGQFTFDDVVNGLCQKLVRRHPHIFGEAVVHSAQEVKYNWEEIKREERGSQTYGEMMQEVPQVLPALLRAYKVQQKAAHVGFDWDHAQEVMAKIEEEWEELKKAHEDNNKEGIVEELGDLLFSIVNLSRFLKINPEITLTNAIEKFINRFVYVENTVLALGKSLEAMTLKEMDLLWDEAKEQEF